ncbi:MAG: hypothetical protein MUF15_21190, partial [Acidobacteria bacterium]|nr:hypothetical protein [Acidobacteriota bacterium]
FRHAYANASNILPNNNILNLISKVKKDPYREIAIELFQTDEKIKFRFDNENLNYLYMNGVIDYESVETDTGEIHSYCKFSSPFVQARLFNFFSWEMFHYMGALIHPLDAMEDAVTMDTLNVRNIMKRYQAYLDKNKETFFRDVPRRKRDLKIYEAIYHFNLYRYLYNLLEKRGVDVIPEFPTGNGKIDLILKYKGRVYALELKSFSDIYDFREGIDQAAQYGQKLRLTEIAYVVFVELKAEEIKQLEQEIEKPGIRVNIVPISVLPG